MLVKNNPFGIAGFFFMGHTIDGPNGNLIVGSIIGAYATTQAFMGFSQSSRLRADQAIDFAHRSNAASAPPHRK